MHETRGEPGPKSYFFRFYFPFWLAPIALWVVGVFLFGVSEHAVLSLIRPLVLGQYLPIHLNVAATVLSSYLLAALVTGIVLQAVLAAAGGLFCLIRRERRTLSVRAIGGAHLVLLTAGLLFAYLRDWFSSEIIGLAVDWGFLSQAWPERADYLWGPICLLLSWAVVAPLVRRKGLFGTALLLLPALTAFLVAGFHLNTKVLPGFFEWKSVRANLGLLAGALALSWAIGKTWRFAKDGVRLGSVGGGIAAVALVTLVSVLTGPVTAFLPRPRAEGSVRGGRPHIVFINMDEARADRVSAYGGSPLLTPWLERLRREAMTFDRAYAPSGWTIPTHASFFTGKFSYAHGVHARSNWYLSPSLKTLAEFLRAAGYRTVGMSANPILGQWTGFDRGFDTFLETWRKVSNHAIYPIYQSLRELTALVLFGGEADLRRQVLVQRAQDQPAKAPPQRQAPPAGAGTSPTPRPAYPSDPSVESLEAEDAERDNLAIVKNAARVIEDSASNRAPLFLFINFYAPHEPYVAPKVFYERVLRLRGNPAAPAQWEKEVEGLLQSSDASERGPFEVNARVRLRFDLLNYLYDVKQAYGDWLVGQIYQALQKANLLDRTLFVVTSDHGQMLGERGLFGHGEVLYEPVIWVPLFLRDPERLPKGARFTGLVSLVDIFPTILERAGLRPDSARDIQGRSLFEMLKEGKGRAFTLSEAYFGKTPLRALIASNSKLLAEEGKAPLLYDLRLDPEEKADLAGVRPQEALDLQKILTGLGGGAEAAGTDREKGRPGLSLDPETRKRLRALGYLE